MAKHGLSMPELGSLLDSYRINLDRMHMQLLSSADMLRLLMDGAACRHSLVHLEDERVLAQQLAKGEFLDRSKTAATETSSEEPTAKSARMKRLLNLINEEASNMLSWLDARNVAGGGNEGPDAICAFLVQSRDTRGTAQEMRSVPGSKGMPNTQLQGHVEADQTEVTKGMVQATTLPGAGGGRESRGEEDSLGIPEKSILNELCSAMTSAIPLRRKGVDVRLTHSSPTRPLNRGNIAANHCC